MISAWRSQELGLALVSEHPRQELGRAGKMFRCCWNSSGQNPDRLHRHSRISGRRTDSLPRFQKPWLC